MVRIRVVDGFKIRNTIDVDFAVIGNHDIYSYIDRGEFWFDKAFVKEKDFFVRLFQSRSVLTKKYGYECAKEILRTKMKAIVSEKIKLRLIKKEQSFSIYLVNGALVRQAFDPSFCFGGHWLIYKYIPKNEIWIDNVALPKERKYVMVHEIYELRLMKKKMSYNNAHDYACAAEKEARRNDGVGHYLKD